MQTQAATPSQVPAAPGAVQTYAPTPASASHVDYSEDDRRARQALEQRVKQLEHDASVKELEMQRLSNDKDTLVREGGWNESDAAVE